MGKPCNVHDESQVREHQLAGSIQVGLGAEANRQRDFVFLRENRNLRYAVYVGVQAPDRSRKYQTARLFRD
jgi:hypothetical protein